MSKTEGPPVPTLEGELIFLRNLPRRSGDNSPMTAEEEAMALEVGLEFAGRRPVVLASPSWRSTSVARQIAVGAGDVAGSYEVTSEVGDPSLFVLPSAEEAARSSLEALGGKQAFLEAAASGDAVEGWQPDMQESAWRLVRNCLAKADQSPGRLVLAVTYDLVAMLVLVGLSGRQDSGAASHAGSGGDEWPYLGRLTVRLEPDGDVVVLSDGPAGARETRRRHVP